MFAVTRRLSERAAFFNNCVYQTLSNDAALKKVYRAVPVREWLGPQAT